MASARRLLVLALAASGAAVPAWMDGDLADDPSERTSPPLRAITAPRIASAAHAVHRG